MTDEMIQQVPQQKGNYAIPGLLTGAVAGGALGYGASYYKNLGFSSKADYENHIAQKPDTFDSSIKRATGDNKTYFEAAKEEAQKIQEAGAKFDKIVEEAKTSNAVSELPDGDIKKAYDKAKADYESALSNKKNEIAKTSRTGEFKFPTAEEVKNLGDKVKLEDVNAYKTYLENYQNALKNAEKSADRTAIEAFKTNVADHLTGVDAISKKPNRFFKAISKKIAFNNKLNEIKAEIETIYPEITDAKRIQHELKVAGKDYKPGSKNYKAFVKQLNQQVKADREALFNEILGDKIKVDVVDPKTKKVIGQRTTFTNVEAYMNELQAEKNRLAKFENRPEVKKLGGSAKLRTVKEYQKDLQSLEKNKNKITVAQYEKAKKQLEAEKTLATEFEKINTSVANRKANFFNRISHTKALEEKVQRAINNNPAVQSTLQKLKNFANSNEAIKGIAFNAEEGSLTAEEIAKMAEEALKDQKVATDFAAADKAAKDELARLGKSTELTGEALTNAIKEKCGFATKEEFTKSVTEAAKERLKGLAEKTKIAHVGKTAGAAAAVLGILGLIAGASSKKEV